jgi:ABC-2 type transport system ATP-binding protein
VWTEVRRLNEELGVTIFLTTQYLEEADALASRVSIIAGGRIVAEGTPAELKRSVGRDVVIVRIEGRPETAEAAMRHLTDVEHLERAGHEIRVAVSDGPAAIPTIAGVLAQVDGVTIREMALRRPSLDDVFFTVTGERLTDAAFGDEEDGLGGPTPTPPAAGTRSPSGPLAGTGAAR